MKILFIGDIYGEPGRIILANNLDKLRNNHEVDFTIVNCENMTNGRGLNKKHYEATRKLNIDAITMGNHIFGQNEIFDYLNEDDIIVRPLNGHPNWPGKGVRIFTVQNKKIAVINMLGMTGGMQATTNPFVAFDLIYAEIKNSCDYIFVDFHAELTSEKIAFGHHLDGRASAVVGTHTHVPTADNRVLIGGTAYISDVGMTGPLDGVIGVKKEIIIQRFLKNYPARFEVAKGRKQLNAVIIEINDATGYCKSIERIHINEV
jgi:metallophosphoesterase, MG_246/BB_0505 family